MLFQAIFVAFVAFATVNANLEEITKNMRDNIEWLYENSQLDHNSTIILLMATGSLTKQYKAGIETQVQMGYLDLIVALSREKLAATNPEARLYFSWELVGFVGDFSQGITLVDKEAVCPDSVYEIYTKSQESQKYKGCVDTFYKDNPNIHTSPMECDISQECTDLMLDSSDDAEVGPVLRNRFVMIAEKLHKCNNFSPNYNTIVADQLEKMNAQVNKFLANIADNGGTLDPRLRYTFLRRIVLLLINGYDVMTPTIVKYLMTLYNEEGFSGVAEDEHIDKVVLTSQCYAIGAFARQLELAAQETTTGA